MTDTPPIGPPDSIEWRAFDPYPENTVYCHCGAVFRSHTKAVMRPVPRIISRKSCPSCGKDDDLRRASSDPERMTIGKDGR